MYTPLKILNDDLISRILNEAKQILIEIGVEVRGHQ